MNRRAFVTGIAAAVGSPRVAGAESQMRQVGYLAPSEPTPRTRPYFDAFRQGLRDLGYVEGQNLKIVYRSADGHFERLPGLAAELTRLNVDVLVVGGNEGVAAAKAATQTIPIVMRIAGDPIGSGYAVSLGHPGGNITGLSAGDIGVSAKRLELLKEAVPKITRVAVLWNPPQTSHAPMVKDLHAAALTLRLKLQPYAVSTDADLDRAFSAMATDRVDGLMVPGSGLHLRHLSRIAAEALERRLPAISFFRQFVELSGLMAYSPDEWDLARRAATYVDKILKGAKPADLPIEQPTKYELVINLKTAKALGLTIPQSLLLRADQLIE